jgi:5-methylthioadenosine/S-adenosylhomocysteine deaminase
MTQTLIAADRAIPNADIAPQSDYAIVVEGNRIVASGAQAVLSEAYSNAQVLGGAGLLMLPAFVNAHDHGRALGTATLGVPDDWLEIWLPYLGALPPISPYLAALWESIQLIKSGVGTTAHSHNPQTWAGMANEVPETLRGYREVGVRVAMHPPMVDQNTLVYADAEGFITSLPQAMQAGARASMQPLPFTHAEYVALCEALYQQYHDVAEHRVHLQISPAGGQWCSDSLMLAATEWARTRGTQVQMHMLETRYQRQYAYRTWGKGFVQHLDDIGVLGSWLVLAHMVHIEEEDIALLAARGVNVAHNPSSNLRLRSGIAPLAKLVCGGVRVGVGLDGHALDDDQDYLRELRLAWTLGNMREADSEPLSAAQMLTLGTQNGAAMTLPNAPLGTLEVGKLADVVLLDLDALRGAWSPLGYPAQAELVDFVMHRASRSHVKHVMINGRWVLRDSVVQTVNEAEVAAALRAELAQVDWDALRRKRVAAQQMAAYMRKFYAQWD